jgi:DNA repair protein RadD
MLFSSVPQPVRQAMAPVVELRPYQQRAVVQLRALLRAGKRKVLVVAPTGAGKTVIFCYVIAGALAKGSRALVLAHRTELIDQTVDKLMKAGIPAMSIGVLQGARSCNTSAPVIVASVQTAINRRLGNFDLVIIDEAHRALAKSYQDIADQFPTAVSLGFTATPWRLDGKGLGRRYDDLVVVATVAELIAAGFLVRPRVFSHPEKPDLSGVKLAHGDYDEKALAQAVDQKPLIGNIVEHWLKLANNALTIAFGASVPHSKHMVEAFAAAGVAAEHLDGTMPADQRAAILKRLARGETRVVANCAVLTEGFDLPAVKCAILARPTKSRTLYLQCAGRALRPIPGAPDVTTALILDHGGCAHEHGLPQDPQEYSLEDAPKKRSSSSGGAVRQCTQCYAWSASAAKACTECGAPFPTNERPLMKEADGQLREIEHTAERAARLEVERVSKLRKAIQALAHRADEARGWEPGTANRVLFNMFGSRQRMTLAELETVKAYLEKGEFERAHPRPAAAPVTEQAPAEPALPPAWLLEGGDQVVEVIL